jgi:predicted Zn-dependent peptidase
MHHNFTRIFLSGIFFLIAGILHAQQATTFTNDPIQVKHYTLKNGLQVYLSENHDQPKIFGMVAVRAGGKHDPKDATGIAHYLEHMLFKGTDKLGTINYAEEKILLDSISQLYEELGKTTDAKHRTEIQKEINRISVNAAKYAIPNEMDRMLSEIGGNDVNAFTTEEHTAYFNSFPSHEIEKWLDVYAHRFENPVFRLFQSELETVYEEKNRSNDNTFGMVYEEFMKHFYKNHPYGQQTILGTTEHLKNPSLKKMYDYYNTYYVANNMALFLSGDFNADEVFQYIEARFSNWRNAPIPAFPKYEEVPFKGKEKVTVKMTPVKAEILGFRTVPNKHKDKAAIELLCNLLSNPEQSGYIDRLTAEGKLLMAYVLPLVYNDHGGVMIAIVPKIFGQSITKAEALVWNEINKIKKGEFDESLLEAAKINMLKSQKILWEKNEERVIQLLESFSQNISWGDYIKNMEAINAVKKEDIVRVANTYLGDNHLAFVSKMGFPRKEKLPKPGFIPVIPDKESSSEFYTAWKNKNYDSQKNESKISDYNIALTSVKSRVTLKRTENPFNNIFSADIRYGIGYYDIPELKYTAQYLNMLGTSKMTNDELRKRMYALGCSYNFICSENEFIVSIEGLENNLEEALKLINQIIHDAKADKEKDKKLIDNIFAEHKIMSREPNYVSQGLQEYVLYGEKSNFLNTLSKKEIKALKGEQLLAKLNKAIAYEVTISYVGKRTVFDVKEAFEENIKFNENLQPQKGTIVRDRKSYNENLIFIVNKKGAMQSQINYNIEGSVLDLEKIPVIDAFNQYFGNDMSSLVFQEIREFRSLAYSAYGRYNPAPVKGKQNRFNAYIGCQADKTEDALEAMMNLIRNMPEKPERIDGIKSALVLSAQTSRPEFRNVISNVERWYDKGYTENPFKTKVPAYKNLTFNDLVSFYKSNIKEKNVVITIVSDKKKLNLKALEKFGKIKEVKEKDLFKM